MICDCDSYGHLEVSHHVIYKRLKESGKRREKLKEIATKEDLNQCLFKCPTCNQFWQSSLAGNWNSKEYFYKVPEITIDIWLEESFIEPDELVTYLRKLLKYAEKQDFPKRDILCRRENCKNYAVTYSVFCEGHQFANLVQFPKGRLFHTYNSVPRDGLIEMKKISVYVQDLFDIKKLKEAEDES